MIFQILREIRLYIDLRLRSLEVCDGWWIGPKMATVKMAARTREGRGFCKSCSTCKWVGNLCPCDEFAKEEKIHDPREDMFRYSWKFWIDVNNSFKLAGVDHPLLYQHMIPCTTCCIFGNDWVFQSYVPCKQLSSCYTGLRLKMTW